MRKGWNLITTKEGITLSFNPVWVGNNRAYMVSGRSEDGSNLPLNIHGVTAEIAYERFHMIRKLLQHNQGRK